MFAAVDENYDLNYQYAYTWDTVQDYSGQLRNRRIWPNFLNFIEWMDSTNTFTEKRFYQVIGKSYQLDNNVLIRCDEGIEFQKWLISSMFRHVQNPDRDLMGKYVGKIRFVKKYKDGKPGELEDQGSNQL